MGFFSGLSGVMGTLGLGGPSGVVLRHTTGKLLVEDNASALTQAQGADPVALQDFVTKNYGDANYAGGGSIPATSVGQVLYSTNGSTFTAQQPLTSSNGWMVNSNGILLVTGP